MLRPLLLALAITAAFGTAQAADPAAAAAGGHHGGHRLAQYDSNGDGQVTQDEFLAAAATRFDSLDTRHRGQLDATDLATAPDVIARDDRRAEFISQRLDTNNDGKVDATELAAANDKLFARLDSNGDGVISADEAKAGHGGHGGGKAHSGFADFVEQKFAAADSNHDGNLSRAEFDAAAKAHFADADSNHDGVLSTAEMADSPRVLQRNAHMAEAMLKKMDTNGDGLVSRDEYLAASKQRFASMDRNGDGVLNRDDRPARRTAADATTPAKPN